MKAVLLSLLLCCPVFAADPWEAPPFTADPKAMITAAEAIQPQTPDEGVLVLLDEEHVTFDASGRAQTAERLVYRVLDESGVEGWSSIETVWSPWYHERPVVDARVITKDGAVHRLDPKSFGTADAVDEPDMFSDTRILSGPLPAVAPGSIVEQTITRREKNPLYAAGSAERHQFGNWVESRRSRLTLEWPDGVTVRTVNRTGIEPKATATNGVTRLVFELGTLPAFDYTEWGVPAEANEGRYVAWSTGKSWQDVATRYSDIVNEKIGDLGNVDAITKSAVGDAKTPRDIAVRLLAAVQRNIRYAGVEFGEGSIIPRTPVETLKNKYGDCKDKATLLVAMLRRAGIPAHVALLRSGRGYDVEADLPGFGYFDHVIVVTGGDDPIWIDPTDEFARAGELPDSDQGRLVLIARPETTALVKTEQGDSKANRAVETREFTLAEDGKARIVETNVYSGSDERMTRRYYNSSDQKHLREGLEDYVKEAYLATALTKWHMTEARDLSSPFRLTIEMNEATRGITGGGEAAVGVFFNRLVADLPLDLRTAIDEKDPEYKPRKHDYEISKPYALDLRYIIHPPPGYVMRSMPENEVTSIGSMTITKKYQVREDGVLLADFTFDSGPRRIPANQYEEVRRAVSKLAAEPAVLLYFDQAGRKFLDAGEVGKAVAEFRRLSASHPKEALHHADVARALMLGGMGAAARREAKRAVGVEPKSHHGHWALAYVLSHDLIGRELKNGCDVAGAAAAYRKAKELAPKNVSIRAELAMLLEYDADGVRYSKNAPLEEAIAEYLELKKLEGVNVDFVERELMALYTYTRKWTELKKLTAETVDTVQKNTFVLIAAGATDGPEGAIKAAQAIEPAKRREAEVAAGGYLALLRFYPAAAALIGDAAQGGPNAAQLRVRADMLRKTMRYEDRKIDPADPQSVWQEVMREFWRTGSTDGLEKYATADSRTVFEEDSVRPRARKASEVKVAKAARQLQLNGDFLADLTFSAIEMQQDGNESVGYRLRGRSVVGDTSDLTLFVVKEDGSYRIAADSTRPPELALRALRLLEKNDLAAARQWLDWAREGMEGGYRDDPLASEPFAALWTRGKEASADEIRLAAAVLLPDTKRSSELAIPILVAAREQASPDVQWRIDQALVMAFMTTSAWNDALAAGDRLASRHPDSTAGFAAGISALDKLGRTDEMLARAKARLEKIADDPAALNVLAELALERSDYAEAMTYYKRIVDRSRPEARDYNQAAWTALFAGSDLEKALEYARQAVTANPESYPALNTLAVVYAEQGKSSEARDTLLQSLDKGNDDLGPADWYVVGRIAESHGIRDVAVDAYRQIPTPPASEKHSSPWELAQKGLARLK